jgi:hypothetical protein
MSYAHSFLTDDQAKQFLTQGYVTVKNCFSRETAKRWTDRAFERLGYDPGDPRTWEQGRVHMPAMDRWLVREFAPRAWAAIVDLLGGEERIGSGASWGDSFIVNFHDGADRPWLPPSAQSPGWHKDGDFFVHFLDSPEQGLLTLVLWSDIKPRAGGTFIATDSVPAVARYLLEHPEGLKPNEFDFRWLISQCSEFLEVTGETGDVILLHPYMLHASSQNPSGIPRFITNPPVALKEPMRFNRENPGDLSLVERATLRGLGLERLDYVPKGERMRLTPERERIQRKMLEEETNRLTGKGVS